MVGHLVILLVDATAVDLFFFYDQNCHFVIHGTCDVEGQTPAAALHPQIHSVLALCVEAVSDDRALLPAQHQPIHKQVAPVLPH